MKYILFRLKRFCGFLAGFVFFIAGIFKLLDPVGTGLIMQEYFHFLHLDFLAPVAKPAGVLFAFVETTVGTALVTGVWRKVTVFVALAFQLLFTLLTLMLVIFNPQMDCGCFGEAIHLTHIQTFLKNLVLLAMLLAFAFPLRHLGGPKKHKYASFAIVTVSVFAFGTYSWLRIPLVDYTAFKPAVALQAGHAFETAYEDMFETVFVYEKDGQIQEYDLGHLPDSTWDFVETKTVMKKGFEESVVSLSFSDDDGEYRDTLAVRGKVMVMSVYDAGMKSSRWVEVADFLQEAARTGFRPLLLVASTPQNMSEILAGLPAKTSAIIEDNLYYSDRKTLITMNRSNAGVTYFSDGYLVCKWAGRALPDVTELEELHSGDDTELIIGNDTSADLAFQAFLLYVFAVMLLL